MWCTQCNIAFSWNTGKKVRGVVHNPHYYEWIKNGGGQAVVPGAMLPCGGLPTAFTMREALKNIILPDNFRKEGNEINSKQLFDTLQNTRELHYLFSDCNLQVITNKWFDSAHLGDSGCQGASPPFMIYHNGNQHLRRRRTCARPRARKLFRYVRPPPSVGSRYPSTQRGGAGRGGGAGRPHRSAHRGRRRRATRRGQ